METQERLEGGKCISALAAVLAILDAMETTARRNFNSDASNSFFGQLLRSAMMKWLCLNMNFSPKVLLKLAWCEHASLTNEKHKAYQIAFGSHDERQFSSRLVNMCRLKMLVNVPFSL